MRLVAIRRIRVLAAQERGNICRSCRDSNAMLQLATAPVKDWMILMAPEGIEVGPIVSPNVWLGSRALCSTRIWRYGGLTTRQILQSQLGPALAMRPDLATVVSGTNDLLRTAEQPRHEVRRDEAARTGDRDSHPLLTQARAEPRHRRKSSGVVRSAVRHS
jgi:hypothetical protein